MSKEFKTNLYYNSSVSFQSIMNTIFKDYLKSEFENMSLDEKKTIERSENIK